MAARMEIPDPHVPARSRRPDCRKARNRRLWAASEFSPMALRGAHRDAGPPQRVHTAAQGNVSRRALDTQENSLLACAWRRLKH